MHWSAQKALLRLAKQRSRCGDLMAMCVMWLSDPTSLSQCGRWLGDCVAGALRLRSTW